MNKFTPNTILIAEDDENSRVMLRVFLEGQGYKTVEAKNGKEAVEVAGFALPDLILMNLNLPALDGLKATKQIRERSELCCVPIIANSADGRRGIDLFLSIDNLGHGFIGYVARPLNLEDLSEQIKMALLTYRKFA